MWYRVEASSSATMWSTRKSLPSYSCSISAGSETRLKGGEVSLCAAEAAVSGRRCTASWDGAAAQAVVTMAAASSRDHWDRRSTPQSSAEGCWRAEELGFVTGP